MAKAKTKPTGVELIAAERTRQIEKEEWTPEHDALHKEGELAWAAVCYAAPKRIFVMDATDDAAVGMSFTDPWPWDRDWDKRREYGTERGAHTRTNRLPNPKTYCKKERLDLLVKAGALIAAEIDRLQRMISAPHDWS